MTVLSVGHPATMVLDHGSSTLPVEPYSELILLLATLSVALQMPLTVLMYVETTGHTVDIPPSHFVVMLVPLVGLPVLSTYLSDRERRVRESGEM